MHTTTRSDKLGCTYDERDEQGASRLHSGDNDAVLDNIPMKGCTVEEKDETMDDHGCRKFVVDHIRDCEKVLRKLEDVHLTLSGEKSAFEQEEILVVRHLCGSSYEGSMRVTIQSLKVSWSMCILSHMDSVLCTHCGPTQSLVAEG